MAGEGRTARSKRPARNALFVNELLKMSGSERAAHERTAGNNRLNTTGSDVLAIESLKTSDRFSLLLFAAVLLAQSRRVLAVLLSDAFSPVAPPNCAVVANASRRGVSAKGVRVRPRTQFSDSSNSADLLLEQAFDTPPGLIAVEFASELSAMCPDFDDVFTRAADPWSSCGQGCRGWRGSLVLQVSRANRAVYMWWRLLPGSLPGSLPGLLSLFSPLLPPPLSLF